ncbi:uncharacterized protein BKA55DRAFT_530996, partial [Fusarium redolens]
KVAVLAILNMFNNNITYLIKGINNNYLFNTLILTLSYYISFSNFYIYFKPIRDILYIYYIGMFLLPSLIEDILIT